jgi:hypothetical protein
MISLGAVWYCFASAKRAARPTENERVASISVNIATLFALLTDSRIKVGDNRREYDDGQLDGLAPFGPLKGIRVNVT